jgi:hypothetical protein
MKFSVTAILSVITFTLIATSEPAWSAAKKFDRGTCLTLAKQKYGIRVGHTLLRAAADRCVAQGPSAL